MAIAVCWAVDDATEWPVLTVVWLLLPAVTTPEPPDGLPRPVVVVVCGVADAVVAVV